MFHIQSKITHGIFVYNRYLRNLYIPSKILVHNLLAPFVMIKEVITIIREEWLYKIQTENGIKVECL